MRAGAVCAALAAALSIAPGAARAGDDPFARGLWPLWIGDASPWAGVRETRAFGPFYETFETEDAHGWVARPLLSRRFEPDRERWDLLYPLGARERTAERDDLWFLLLLHRERELASQKRELRTGMSFRGTNADGEPSRGMFPFYGTFRGRLGMDEIRFVLFPIFARGKLGGFTETHVLWPFFGWGSGDGRSMLRVWPLFGYDDNEGRWRRAFWLWPFVHRKHQFLDSPRPERALWVVPFYGRREIGSYRTRFWMFPLLVRQWDLADPEVGATDVLWPFWSSSANGRGQRMWALRPLWWHKTTPDSRRDVALLGLVGREHLFASDVRGSAWQLFWASSVGQRQEGFSERRWADVWPLFRARYTSDGEGEVRARLRAPFLLPMRGLDPDGWETHWNGLFEVYRRDVLENERRTGWLWGLYETRERPGEAWHSLAGALHLHFDE